MAEYLPGVKIVNKELIKPRIKINYPRVVGMESKLIQWRINRRIKDKVDMLISGQGFLGNLREMIGSYKITLNGKGLLSIRFENYAYLEGAAHGLTDVGSLNLDIKTGIDYSLRDLFLPEGSYVETISTIIADRIEDEDIPLTREFSGISPEQEYYLKDRALVIYFQLYEFTPYAYGIPEFRIPLARLHKILNPNLHIF